MWAQDGTAGLCGALCLEVRRAMMGSRGTCGRGDVEMRLVSVRGRRECQGVRQAVEVLSRDAGWGHREGGGVRSGCGVAPGGAAERAEEGADRRPGKMASTCYR